MIKLPQTSSTPATFSGRYQPGSIGRSIVIILVGIGLVMLVTWFVPALTLTSQNVLFRLRGPIEPSRDIVILAIDDRSLQQVGPWPWRREIMAEILDRLTPARPRVIGIDIIYSEPLEGTGPIRDSDRLLAESIRANGRVVLPAQLYVARQGQAGEVIEWLRPAGMFVDGAAAIGHVHVAPGVDGMVRTVQLSKASDRGERVWAFGLELLRLSENLDYAAIVERQGALQVGSRRIPVSGLPDREPIPGVTVLRSNEMQINFAGATGSFTTLSIADLLNGDLPGERFRDRIVLIGATAPSMGDSRLAPFTHYGNDLTQGGREMPGVEIHANIINTIRAGLYFRPLSDQVSFLLALLVMALAAVTVYWLDGWRQLTLLGLLLLVMVAGSYFAFDRLLILPPIVPMLTGFAVVLPLLLNRSLAVSRELDDKLATLTASHRGFLPERSATLSELPARAPGLGLSHSFNWKLKAVESLTDRLLARLSFINRILASMGDGVVVTDPAGRIVLVNRITGQLLDIPTESLIGQPVVDMLTSLGKIDSASLKRSLAAVLSHDTDSGRGEAISSDNHEVNFSISGPDTRHFSLLFSALIADAEAIGATPATPNSSQDPKEVIGVVILISDITKRVELDRVKTETLQLVSHELRNPLSSIQALSEVLLKFPVTPDKTKEMLTSIHDESKRLGETLNQYLDLSRLESGVRPIKVTMTEPAVLIDQCLRQHAVAANRKQIRLLMATDPILPRLAIDAGLIGIAIGNLIGNAIKYSPQQTEVTVTAESVADRLLISVRDQGPGIPDAARDRIFEKFYRLERDNDSETIGSGLGLPLVREILERHGGEVSFLNQTGGGAVFTLSIPLTVHRRHTRS